LLLVQGLAGQKAEVEGRETPGCLVQSPGRREVRGKALVSCTNPQCAMASMPDAFISPQEKQSTENVLNSPCKVSNLVPAFYFLAW
jgi:predicted dinucleotide-binding enzyme